MDNRLILQSQIENIDKLVKETIISENVELTPILDGVIDIDKYWTSKYKILWVLKEPYDDKDESGNPFGGGWSIPELIRSKQTIWEFEGGGRPTYRPMIYTSWGIFNNFCQWDDMKDVEDDPSMLEALKSIAYINIKKLPGVSESRGSHLQKAYNHDKELLFKQIECINPDIVIFGYTISFFLNDLGFKFEDFKRLGSLKYFIHGNRIYIDAHHPAQRPGITSISVPEYCNDIINAVKIWAVN
jgi:hypothetical protein